MSRRLSEIKDLPISQLTDEEIVKAAMHRLDATYCAIMYRGRDGQSWYIDRWKNKYGRAFSAHVHQAWANTFGKMKSVNEKDPKRDQN